MAENDERNERIIKSSGARGAFDTENEQGQIADFLKGGGGTAVTVAVIAIILYTIYSWIF